MRVLRLEGGRIRSGGRELAGPGAPIWIDLAPTPDGLAFLAERFHFHPLALEDCAHEDQRTKFEQYPDHLFTVVHRIRPSPDDGGYVTRELHAFLTAEAVITVHSEPIPEVEAVWARCLAEPELLRRGPDFVLYLLHDALTDLHFALVDDLTDEVEAIAAEAMASGADGQVAELVAVARRKHAVLRRRLSPQREVFAALARPGIGLVREQTAVYFRDVVDHVVRITEEVDMGRDLLASAMETWLSGTNNRLSHVTTRLTLIATIFLPLNFVAGFFGMNLEVFPHGWAIPIVVGSMLVLPVVMFTFFKRKGWI
jgi:magnesium transporter